MREVVNNSKFFFIFLTSARLDNLMPDRIMVKNFETEMCMWK